MHLCGSLDFCKTNIQCLTNAQIFHVGTSTHFSGNPTNQELGSLKFSEADFCTGPLPDGP
jgi:hypothetical protein